MKINMTLEFDEQDRRIINWSRGRVGLASREDCIVATRLAISGEIEQWQEQHDETGESSNE